jgi:hypothetical protein
VITVTLREGESGLFSGEFTAAMSGLYVVRVRAAGSTFSGRQFEREQTLTASALPGADQPPRTDPGLIGWLHDHDRRICHLLTCLLEDGALGRLLGQHGMDPATLRRCIEHFCRDVRYMGGETPRQGKEQPYSVEDLQRALARLVKTTLSAEAIATMPEPQPIPPPATPKERGPGKMMGGTMFGLSPEDLAAGEPPEAEPRHEGKHPPKGTGQRGPRTHHGLSPEDQEAEKKREE